MSTETSHSARRLFGVLIPATNTTVEPEFNDLRIGGATWHASRMPVRQTALGSDDSFAAFVTGLNEEIKPALDHVMSAGVEHIVLGTSAQVFWGGRDGAAAVESKLLSLTGRGTVTTAATALVEALKALGATRVGVLTPYPSSGDERLRSFLEEYGVRVVSLHSLRAQSVTGVSAFTTPQVREGLHAANSPQAQALIQVGTNLPCIQVAARMEEEVGKPVVALNAALAWHAYRNRGITDRTPDWGSLLARC